MGNEQPKKLVRVTKAQIDMGSLKAKIHLELVRDRKNNEIIKGEKELVMRIKSKSRNRTEEILIAERVVNGLKYVQACNQLMAYAMSIRAQANFISDNMLNPEKISPWLPQIYSLLYAADLLGLSSLKEFKDLMRALNDPAALVVYVNPDIISLLAPTPTPEELNIYMLEFSNRNGIELEEINIAGHKFTKDFHPTGGNNKNGHDDSFEDLERRLAEELKNKAELNGGNHQNGPNGLNWNNGQGEGNNFGPSGWGGNQDFNQNPNPNFNPNSTPGFVPVGLQTPDYYGLDKPDSSKSSNPYGIRESYQPPPTKELPSNPQQPRPSEFADSRISFKSIDDIDYFPEIEPMKQNDPDFDRICEVLRGAM